MAANQESLNTLPPDEAWRPAPAAEWNLKWAAHLYRRAAFGFPPPQAGAAATPRQRLADAVNKGRDAAIDALLAADGPTPLDELLDRTGRQLALQGSSRSVYSSSNDAGDGLRGWWIYRMLYSPRPLAEKCTLFWHGHFSTSIDKVKSNQWMFQQNCLLRRFALGSFAEMLHAVARDSAMMAWLDTQSNVAAQPNENFARELMELFTLGTGKYTERDVGEAARAFTGWTTLSGKFYVNEPLHDDGPKQVLGKQGSLSGDDVIDVLLAQPGCARLVVRKLFRFFISEADVPSDALIEPLAVQLRQSQYNVHNCLATMLRSRLFFSEYAYRQRIKSPVEYVLELSQNLNLHPRPDSLSTAAGNLGQQLFAPPGVKGWEGGPAWLNSATLLARHNFAWKLLTNQAGFDENEPPSDGDEEIDAAKSAATEAFKKLASQKGLLGGKPRLGPNIDMSWIVSGANAGNPQATADELLERFVQSDIAPQSRAQLIEYLTEHAAPRPAAAASAPAASERGRRRGRGGTAVADAAPAKAAKDNDAAGDQAADRLRRAAHAILCSPEYQLA
ncbi:MAG: DUF1800 domain-containing protein [Planctomycetia bacterium]|nr:DUF1800 domain-containing protein [Planctomycetia bacterium]